MGVLCASVCVLRVSDREEKKSQKMAVCGVVW